MAQASSVTSDEIVAALGSSSRFPAGSQQFEVFAPVIGHLTELIGEDHLDDSVGLGNLCSVTGRYVTWLAESEEFLDSIGDEAPLVSMLYKSLGDELEVIADDPESMLEQMDTTEAEALESEQLGLNEAAKVLLRNGKLTFSKLLVTSPEVFIPRS